MERRSSRALNDAFIQSYQPHAAWLNSMYSTIGAEKGREGAAIRCQDICIQQGRNQELSGNGVNCQNDY